MVQIRNRKENKEIETILINLLNLWAIISSFGSS